MPANRRVLWALILVGSAAALVLASRIATEQLIVGSREGGWVYFYVRHFGYRSLRVSLIATLFAGMLLAIPDRVYRRREWLMVAVWVLAGFAIQALLRTANAPVAITPMFTSDLANSFYGVTLQNSASAVLGNFATLRTSWPVHAQSNMPGKIMLVYALELLSARPFVLAWLVVFVSTVGGVFMYLFVRDLFDDRNTALFALVLYFLVPAKLFFLPLLNTVTPVLVLLCAFLLLRWLRSHRPVFAGLLGVALYGLVFFEPTALAVGLLFAALLAYALIHGTMSLRALFRGGALASVTFAATYLVMRSVFGFDLFDALGHVLADAVAFNQSQRPYWLWVRQDPIEFLIGVGFCQAFLFLAVVAASLRKSAWRERSGTMIALVSLTLGATLLAIDLMGVNRGEVTRLWIFLACLFQIPAAYLCGRLQSRRAMMLVLATTLLQNALATSMIGFINP